MLYKDFRIFPEIKSERLLLHAMRPGHAQQMFLLRGNEHAMKYIGKPLMKSVDEAEELIDAYNRNLKDAIGITWGISQIDSPGLIGTIGFHKIDWPNHRAEIGYMLHPDYWNKGFMSEAVKAILDYGFKELKLHSVEAKINLENGQSRNLLTKFNFIKEGHFKENFFEQGIFCDTEVYSLLTNQQPGS